VFVDGGISVSTAHAVPLFNSNTYYNPLIFKALLLTLKDGRSVLNELSLWLI
jgi:hypothetical protein